MSKVPIFITFEGGEGCGKTTQSKRIKEYFNMKNISAIWTREIGGTKTAELIREIILYQELEVKSELLMVMAARCEHIENLIKPALASGNHVLCDRFVDSTAAYQGSNLGHDIIYDLHCKLFNNFLPDITFYLDIDPIKALDRAKARGDINKFENKPIEYHKCVQNNFLKIAQKFPDRIVVINALREPEIITKEVCDIINKRFNI